jgi:hypothetical protein
MIAPTEVVPFPKSKIKSMIAPGETLVEYFRSEKVLLATLRKTQHLRSESDPAFHEKMKVF